MIRKFGLDPENKGKSFESIWTSWHDQICVLNGQEKEWIWRINIEEGVIIIQQRADDALNCGSENEVKFCVEQLTHGMKNYLSRGILV